MILKILVTGPTRTSGVGTLFDHCDIHADSFPRLDRCFRYGRGRDCLLKRRGRWRLQGYRGRIWCWRSCDRVICQSDGLWFRDWSVDLGTSGMDTLFLAQKEMSLIYTLE